MDIVTYKMKKNKNKNNNNKIKIYHSPQAIFADLNIVGTVLQTSVKGFRPGYDDIILDEWED